MRTFWLLLSLFPLLTFAGRAQEPAATPMAEIGTSWSYLHAGENAWDKADLTRGWKASFDANVAPWLGLVGEFSGHYGNQFIPVETSIGTQKLEAYTNHHTFLFGPRLFYRTARWTPYVHTLFGFARIHHDQDTSAAGATYLGGAPVEAGIQVDRTINPFAMGLGGGMDVSLNDRVALRAIQADYLITRPDENNIHNWRISTGLNFKLGTLY